MNAADSTRGGPRLFLAARGSGPAGSGRLRQMQALAQGAAAAGVEAVVLHERGVELSWPGVVLLPAFDPTGRPPEPTPFGGVGRPPTLADLDRAVRFDPPRRGDHVLFDCVTAADFADLLEALRERASGGDGPRTHLLLRGRPEANALALQQPAFDRAARAPRLLRNLVLHADDAGAAAELRKLTGLPFTALPLAVSSGRDDDPMGATGAPAAGRRLSVRIHAGGAETDLAAIGSAVASLWRPVLEPGLARVTVVQPATGGSGSPAAARRLMRYPPSHVRLVGPGDPAASAPADIVVAGRDAAALVEAAAAGLPVARAQTATSIDRAGVAYADAEGLARGLGELVARFDAHAQAAREAAPAVRRRHSGEAVVRALLDAPPVAAAPQPGRPGALVAAPQGGAFEAVDVLAAAGFSVTAVVLPAANAGIDAQPQAGDMLAAADARFELPALGASTELRARLAGHPPALAWIMRAEDAETVAALAPGIPAVLEMRDEAAAPADPSRLSGLAAVLAPSEHLAGQLRDGGLPVPVVTIPAAPRPRDALHLLAGCIDLGEVLAACGPPRGVVATSPRARLAGMKALDLVIDGGDGAPDDVAGLGWFLDEVYAPRLAPAGVTLAVLGPVGEAAAWPELPGVAFTGLLGDPSPLRAAARLEVLPAVGGHARAWRTLTALAGGRSVVATPDALLGLLEAHPAVHACDGAEAMAGAIHRLLRSAHARSAASGRTAPAGDYAAAVREAARAATGVDLAPPATSPAGPAVEWGDELRALNRIARTWAEGGWPTVADLAQAAALPRTRLQAALQAILVPLAEGSAPLLRAEPELRRRALRSGPLSAAEGVALVLAATDLLAGRRAASAGAALLFDGAGDLTLGSRSGAESATTYAGAAGARIQLTEAGDPTGAVATLRRSIAASAADVQVERGEFSAAGAVLRQGVRVRLRPPLLAAAAGVARWLELEMDEITPLDIVPALDGHAVRGESHAAAGRRRLRIPMDSAASPARDGLAERLVTLDVVAGTGLLTAMSTRVALDGGALEALGDGSEPARDAEVAPAAAALVSAVAAGRPPSAEAVLAGRADASVGDTASASLGFWDVPVDPAEIEAVLAPAAWTAGGPARFVASPGLSVRCEAVFADAAQAANTACMLDGADGVLVAAEGATRVWSWPGREPGEGGWRRELRLAEGAAAPDSLTWIVNLAGGFDSATADRALVREGFYGREQHEGRTWSWTGPDPVATLRLPLAATRGGSLALHLVGPGGLDLASDLKLAVNGRELELSPLQEGLGVTAELPPAPDGAAVLELRLEVASLFDPPGDPRRLGLGVGELELRFPLPTT